MRKTFYPENMTKRKFREKLRINSVTTIAPLINCEKYDPVCKKAWDEGFFCVKTQDERMTPEEWNSFAGFMNRVHGRRGYT
jgi:hypothetical protein